MKLNLLLSITLILLLSLLNQQRFEASEVLSIEKEFWLEFKRRSNLETLYFGEPGNKEKSEVVKEFRVKSGIPGERPTPLPKLLGREYWLIVDKKETLNSLETAPYFLTLDIPVSKEEPFGPVPYQECDDSTTGEEKQCNWIIPGEFGLHGVAGDEGRLSDSDPGSSGCVRHVDKDITYLYNLLNPREKPVRYYIQDV